MKTSFFVTLLVVPFLGSCVKSSILSDGSNGSRVASFTVKMPVKLGERTLSKVVLSYQKDEAEKGEQTFTVDAQKPGEILNEKFKLEPGKYVFEMKAYDVDTVVGASSFCKEEQKKTLAEIKEGDTEVVLFVCEGSETTKPSGSSVSEDVSSGAGI